MFFHFPSDKTWHPNICLELRPKSHHVWEWESKAGIKASRCVNGPTIVSFQTLAVGAVCEQKRRKKCQLGVQLEFAAFTSPHHAFQSKAVFDSQYEMMGLSPVFAEAIGDTSFQIEVRPIDLWKVKGIWWCDGTSFLPGIIYVESPWVRPAWTCTMYQTRRVTVRNACHDMCNKSQHIGTEHI